MAKTSSVEKNNRRRRMAKRFTGKRSRLKAIIKNRSASMEDRFAAQLKLSQLPRNSAPARIRNRCEITGRPRGFYRKVRMSRMALRELANKGLIPGMVKSSW
ncbi:MAG TPA: 30S ribosomal protein S14 [Aestuariivirgaceae bacterium]|jgi:small subunit ribosomal protein S14